MKPNPTFSILSFNRAQEHTTQYTPDGGEAAMNIEWDSPEQVTIYGDDSSGTVFYLVLNKELIKEILTAGGYTVEPLKE